jgi:hypothetical protein
MSVGQQDHPPVETLLAKLREAPEVATKLLQHIANNDITDPKQITQLMVDAVANLGKPLVAIEHATHHSLAALLLQANVVISEELKDLNAPNAQTSSASKLTVPGQQRGQSDGWQIT